MCRVSGHPPYGAAGSSSAKSRLRGLGDGAGKWNRWPLANYKNSRCSVLPSGSVIVSFFAVRLMN